jgi:hypothetical protein
LALSSYSPPDSETSAQRKPNILVIVGDDMGYGDIGVHGARDLATPHIDALARTGVRLEGLERRTRGAALVRQPPATPSERQ